MQNENSDTLTPQDRIIEGEESLTPKATVIQMNFFDALHAIVDNKRVARVDWKNSDYCLMNDGKLSIFIDGKIRPWIVNDGDLEGRDWIIVRGTN